MSYRIKFSTIFERNIKKLIKQYPSLKEEIIKLQSELLDNPQLGTPIGKNCYKIRIAIQSKGKGKSGGGRVITHLYVAEEMIYLLTIYDKSAQDSISQKELDELIKAVRQN